MHVMKEYLDIWIVFGSNTFSTYLYFVASEIFQFTVKVSQVMYCSVHYPILKTVLTKVRNELKPSKTT